MSEHFIEVCVGCRATISQCRCPGPKTERKGLCSACREKGLILEEYIHPASAVTKFGVLAESALAQAQATMEQSRIEADLSRRELAKRLGLTGYALNRMFEGDYNLTVREFGQVLDVCGYEARFTAKSKT